MFRIEGDADIAVARFDGATDRTHAALRSVVEALAGELLGKVKAATPVRTGALRGSAEQRVDSASTGAAATIGFNPTGGASTGSRRDFYAIFVEFGASLPAHEILPDVKKALRFALEGGGAGFAKRVMFPGGEISAHEMLHGPFQEMRPKIYREIRKAVVEKL